MKKRYVCMLTLLLFRFVIGYWRSGEFAPNQVLRLAGNIDNIHQKDDKCIIQLGEFIARLPSKCTVKSGTFVSLTGKVSKSLLENWQGKIVVDIETISTFSNKQRLTDDTEIKRHLLERLRNFCRDVYRSWLPVDEAALVAGIVLGEKTDIGYEFYQQLIRSGTVHIVVASGYNVLLVGSTILSILFWFGRRSRVVWVAIAAMVFYASLAGGDPPVVRAVLMASMLYLGTVWGRRVDVLWSLFLSIWLMLLWEPAMISSISFQLSVAASLGLMVLGPAISNKLEMPILDRVNVLSTVATMALTAPLIWWHFGRISLMGLFSNLFVLPLVPPLMVLGVGMLVLPSVFFVPTYALSHLLVRIIEFFGII